METYEKVLDILNKQDPIGLLKFLNDTQEYIHEAKVIATIIEEHKQLKEAPISASEIKYVFEEYFFAGIMSKSMAEKLSSMILHPSSGIYS
jgi:hypothetical protein